MDIIQKTVLLFMDLAQRLKSIGELLVSNTAVEDKGGRGLEFFWIFNW